MDTNIFLPLGIQVNTVPFGTDPAMYYRFNSLTAGWAIGDRSNFTGEGGFYISPVHYAKFLAFLNHTQSIIQPSTRELMYENFLGWSDSPTPENAPLGNYGRYYFKSGALCSSNGTCTGQGVRNMIASFPYNDVEVVFMANSRGGNMDSGTALRNMLMSAYDNAWVDAN
jgi:CubicO group peptidase (beta-lactamase class C family)